MTYADRVVFVKEDNGKYDPVSGEHDPPDIKETGQYANVTDLGTDRSVALFGSVKEGSKVIRLLKQHKEQWDHVMIDGTAYNFVTERRSRRRHTIIVKEFMR